MAQPDQVLQPGEDARVVVHVDRREFERARTLPERDHGHHRVPQVLEQARLVLHVAEHDDRVAVPGLDDRRQRDGLLEAAVRVAEDDVVAAAHRLHGQGLDGPGEEGVAEVPDDRPEQHRRGASKAARERVRTVAEPACGQDDAFARLGRDRDPRGDVVEDARHGALRDAGRGRDVAHGRDRGGSAAGRSRPLIDIRRHARTGVAAVLRSHAPKRSTRCGHTIACKPSRPATPRRPSPSGRFSER